MLSSSSRPAVVPLTMASMVLEACMSGSLSAPPVRKAAVSGTMIRLIRIAAGAPSTDAMTKCAAASGISGASSVAYSTSTVPAIPAMPPVITKNSSLRVSCARYGRMNSGASTMPRKILAAVDKPTAPPTPSVRSSSHAMPRTRGGRMRQ